jgi:AmmeMemoRadiSam system protein A
MSPLLSSERRTLLDIARKAISLAVLERRKLDRFSLAGSLADAAGAFVTLRIRGRLRGCIGRLEANEPVAYVVADCAVAAATEDPRFHPLSPVECRQLEIEISVLSVLQRARPEEIEMGLHGLVISRKGQRGVLLPQVPLEHRWSRDEFLAETCGKGGLEPGAWRDAQTRIEIFTAEVFSDSDFREVSSDAGRSSQGGNGYSSSQ